MDETALLATDTIYPYAPQNKWQQSLATLGALVSSTRSADCHRQYRQP